MIGRESRRTVRAETSGAARSWPGPGVATNRPALSRNHFSQNVYSSRGAGLLAIPRPREQRIPAWMADEEDGGSERGKFLRKFAVDC